MQIYLNLTQQEERQLFSDLNTERRDAHVGIIMQYDHRDVYTKITRKIAERLSGYYEIEQKLSKISVQSSALTSLAIIKKCLLAMFEGELRSLQIEPSGRYIDFELIETAAAPFFELWPRIFPKQPAERYKYVSGWSGIQIALAYTVFQLVKTHHLTYPEAIQQLMYLKKHSTWKHTDPLFEHIYDPSSRKIKNHSCTTSIANTAKKFFSIIEKDGMLL